MTRAGVRYAEFTETNSTNRTITMNEGTDKRVKLPALKIRSSQPSGFAPSAWRGGWVAKATTWEGHHLEVDWQAARIVLATDVWEMKEVPRLPRRTLLIQMKYC